MCVCVYSDIIGEGAFSEVFYGFYQGSEVAIKRLKIPLPAQDRNYFMAEVGAASIKTRDLRLKIRNID